MEEYAEIVPLIVFIAISIGVLPIVTKHRSWVLDVHKIAPKGYFSEKNKKRRRKLQGIK